MIWQRYKYVIGIDKEEFDDYYLHQQNAVCYNLYNVEKIFLDPNDYFPNFKAPQNYMYMHGTIAKKY